MTIFALPFQPKGGCAQVPIFLRGFMTLDAGDRFVMDLRVKFAVAFVIELERRVLPAQRHMARRAALFYLAPVLVFVAIGTGDVLHPPKLGAAEDFLPPRYVALCALHCLVFAFQAK